jgi:hypothetical protein
MRVSKHRAGITRCEANWKADGLSFEHMLGGDKRRVG